MVWAISHERPVTKWISTASSSVFSEHLRDNSETLMMISSMRVSMMMSGQHVCPQAHDGIKAYPIYKQRLVADMLIRCQWALND